MFIRLCSFTCWSGSLPFPCATKTHFALAWPFCCLFTGRMHRPENLPSFYTNLSLKLYNVLEDVGASLEVRDIWKECSIRAEILHTILEQPDFSYYLFGSSIEGTTTLGMRPDADVVAIDNNIPIISNIHDASSGKSLLLVHDVCTAAGYCKLQLVHGRSLLFGRGNLPVDAPFQTKWRYSWCIDKMNRVVCFFSPPNVNIPYARHGPALTCENVDTVYAFNNPQWPQCATEWLNRRRHYNWPPSTLIDKCKTLGCLLVPVGHPKSDETDIEWRLSFSHQERLLVLQFNSTQLKCYILLKLIKKEILHHFIGEESLSSYHCKTIMFYMIENTPADFWQPENLLACLVSCMDLLRLCAVNGNCPNYFIPGENMFERKVYGHVQQALICTMQHLLSVNCYYLIAIKTESLGQRLEYSVQYPLSGFRDQIMSDCKFIFYVFTQMNFKNDFLKQCNITNIETCVTDLCNITQRLTNTSSVTEHTEEETQKAIKEVLPYLELSLLSNRISAARNQHESDERMWHLLTSDSWNDLTLQSDYFSCKLKQASLMYMSGFYSSSVDVLLSLVNCVRCSFCYCEDPDEEQIVARVASVLLHMSDIQATRGTPNITRDNLLSEVIVPCVVFLPTEQNVTPAAICYEMLRSADMPAESRDEVADCLYDWAVVDGQFLLHFLLYLNHTKLNMNSSSAADINNMKWVINTRVPCHRETCLNLLGWAYKAQGNFGRAMECFQTSLEIKPGHNAARWHLKDIEIPITEFE